MRMLKDKRIRLIVGGLFFLLLFISATVYLTLAPKREIKKNLNLGNKYLLEENYDGAIAAFNEVIIIDPKNAEAYEGLAEAYESIENYEKEVEILEKALVEVAEKDKIKLMKKYDEAKEKIETKKLKEQSLREVTVDNSEVAEESFVEKPEELIDEVVGGFWLATPHYYPMSMFPDCIQDAGLIRVPGYDWDFNIVDDEIIICSGDEEYLAADVACLVEEGTDLRVRFTYESKARGEGFFTENAIIYYGAKIIDLTQIYYVDGNAVDLVELIVDGQLVGRYVYDPFNY